MWYINRNYSWIIVIAPCTGWSRKSALFYFSNKPCPVWHLIFVRHKVETWEFCVILRYIRLSILWQRFDDSNFNGSKFIAPAKWLTKYNISSVTLKFFSRSPIFDLVWDLHEMDLCYKFGGCSFNGFRVIAPATHMERRTDRQTDGQTPQATAIPSGHTMAEGKNYCGHHDMLYWEHHW